MKFECAYGLFKYCEKDGRRITLSDDQKRTPTLTLTLALFLALALALSPSP